MVWTARGSSMAVLVATCSLFERLRVSKPLTPSPSCIMSKIGSPDGLNLH